MKTSDKAAAELAALSGLPDAKIDTSDIPEREDWTGATRGRFFAKGAASRSLRPMSEEQKSEIRALSRQGISRFEIAERLGVTPGQVNAIRAWVTMEERSRIDREKEVVEAEETTFGLERDLQAALRRNIVELETGLMVADDGKERQVESGGRIGILAKDSSGRLVVIELKAGRADRDAIGQLLAYMGELMQEAPEIRGILVASDFSPRAMAAARAAPNIRLVQYGIRFSFNPIGAGAA